VLCRLDKLKIINCGGYYTIVNLNGVYDNHCHIKKYKTAKMLVNLIMNKRVPKSKYLRESAMRVTIDKKYIEKIEIKEEKDRNRQHYINVNKGVRR